MVLYRDLMIMLAILRSHYLHKTHRISVKLCNISSSRFTKLDDIGSGSIV